LEGARSIKIGGKTNETLDIQELYKSGILSSVACK
jgi:hypothetical protein